MEVKVQYTSELNSILNEVKKLMPASADWTYDLNTIRTYLERGEHKVALSIIHSFRKSMYEVDQRLEDCQAILGGYLQATSPPREEQEDTDGTTS